MFDQPQLDDTLRFLWRSVEFEPGADLLDFKFVLDFEFIFEKLLGFKERHAASLIAFVLEVRAAGCITMTLES